MTDDSASSPGRFIATTVQSTWRTVLMIYYANSLSWRALKAGALFFLGFFVWAGSNILLSYFPHVTILEFFLSYGFVLILYGPFHHLVVIPVYQRLRKQGTHLSLGGHLHLPNLSLLVFAVLVIVLALNPVGLMVIDFTSTLERGGVDITPDLACVKHTAPNGTVTIHCHLSESTGVARVEVYSGTERLLVDDTPPYEFSITSDQLQTVTGNKRFRVDLLAEDGTLIRRYTRTLLMVPSG
ncbi:MAG: Ig-like domain-containing protein [Halobacteriaceae archaeon]